MTYKKTQEIYRSKHKKTVKTCWIADVKRQMGFEVKDAPNKQGIDIINKCPDEHINPIKDIINQYLNNPKTKNL